MTSFETWSLVISAFSAIGTIGAVAIALWATLHRRKRFVVKDIFVMGQMEFPGGDKTQKPQLAETSVHFLLENRQDFQIEVFSLMVMVHKKRTNGQLEGSGSGFGESLRGNFIPAHSQYTVKLDAFGKQMPFSKDEVGKISCEIKTSAGDVVLPLPDKWRTLLFDGLVFVESD